MLYSYRGQVVIILQKRILFGSEIAEIKIPSSNEILEVSITELEPLPASIHIAEISLRAIAAKTQAQLLSQELLAPTASNILPLPHQILVLEKVMGSWPIRFLLADEVGMGKTIEAGLVLKELKLRGKVKRILILVPKTAMVQWQQELKQHFNETFEIIPTELLAQTQKLFSTSTNFNLFLYYPQAILSLDAIKPLDYRKGWSPEKIEEYNRARIKSVIEAGYDLVIIDECHKVGGSSTAVGRYKMAEELCNSATNVLLLSATPHRGKRDHFQRILQLLDPDAFIELPVPMEELQKYVVRTEKRKAIDYEGKPLFNKRIAKIITIQYDKKRHQLQKKLYQTVSDYIIKGIHRAEQDKNKPYGFLMLLFQRLLSSSTQALLESMQKRYLKLKTKMVQPLEDVVAPEELEELLVQGLINPDDESRLEANLENTAINAPTELEEIQKIIEQAEICLNNEIEAKTEVLLQLLKEQMHQENDYNLKFLIFTEFTATQKMLQRVLEQNGYATVIIHGGMDFAERVQVLKTFKEEAQILVSTDAAGESLNMQFAHIVINYDVPFNPMVLEQRIGRVDRIGQKHPVKAFNLLLENSAESRVYEIIETKLQAILEELGIDKTADVLDSTLAEKDIQDLYWTSLLDPKRMEQKEAAFLEEIKQKLLQYKSTENILPSTSPQEISTQRTDNIQQSPLPSWISHLTESYLLLKQIPYQTALEGIYVKGITEGTTKHYIFETHQSFNYPAAEVLHLQHPFIQRILKEFESWFYPTLPILKLPDADIPKGYFSLWQLIAQNHLEEKKEIVPLFFNPDFVNLPLSAEEIWKKLMTLFKKYPYTCLQLSEEDTHQQTTLQEIFSRSEELLYRHFQNLQRELQKNTQSHYWSSMKNFASQQKRIQKIGLEAVRQKRMQRLLEEKEAFEKEFEISSKITPRLKPLLLLQIQ
ncbi:MAG: helicase-related protein [Bacteroidia bacterium]|nr:helicase-related protein [Bacteroidia bacterium]MDW8158447.1 helicase-related protein [Bacteroidia bacterium]